jgi:hypothetical protein
VTVIRIVDGVGFHPLLDQVGGEEPFASDLGGRQPLVGHQGVDHLLIDIQKLGHLLGGQQALHHKASFGLGVNISIVKSTHAVGMCQLNP